MMQLLYTSTTIVLFTVAIKKIVKHWMACFKDISLILCIELFKIAQNSPK